MRLEELRKKYRLNAELVDKQPPLLPVPDDGDGRPLALEFATYTGALRTLALIDRAIAVLYARQVGSFAAGLTDKSHCFGDRRCALR